MKTYFEKNFVVRHTRELTKRTEKVDMSKEQEYDIAKTLENYPLLDGECISKERWNELQDARHLITVTRFSFSESVNTHILESTGQEYPIFFVEWHQESTSSEMDTRETFRLRVLLPFELENPNQVLTIQLNMLEVMVLAESDAVVLAFPLEKLMLEDCSKFFNYRLNAICLQDEIMFEDKKGPILRKVLLLPVQITERNLWHSFLGSKCS
jgi:hypothetical protein